MSRALQYLMKARPEAMAAYFSFLRDNGSRLDARTRDLISIITKVATRTESGLQQYVRRALRDGVSADEILDAILMAFPALGFSKVVWAVDVLLEMDIPGFAPDAAPPAAAWHEIGVLGELPGTGVRRIACDDRSVFVVRDGDEIRVYDTRCPHERTDIDEEGVRGWLLVCPRHGWQFDLKTGASTSLRGVALAAYAHKVEAGHLYARW